MMKVCERFPQIGGIAGYLALPSGEKALYRQFTLDAIEAEAGMPALKVNVKGGGAK